MRATLSASTSALSASTSAASVSGFVVLLQEQVGELVDEGLGGLGVAVERRAGQRGQASA